MLAIAGGPTMHPCESKGVEAVEAFALWIYFTRLKAALDVSIRRFPRRIYTYE
jgi:hypothetical protein